MKITAVFGPAASGKSTLLSRIHTAVALGVVPKTAVVDLEAFWTTNRKDMFRRATNVLRAVSADCVVGGAAVDPAFVRNVFLGANVRCVFLDPAAFDYPEVYALKARLRGVGNDATHQLSGALEVALNMAKWEFDFRGSPDACLWYVLNRHAKGGGH